MALPSLNTPKYDVTLPSGKAVKFRPFLVKEQKLVLQAIEMKDNNQLNNAMDDMLRACTFGEVDLDALPIYDVEYLILQIRSRSVGEVVDINYVCQNTIPDKLLNIEQLKYQPEAAEIRGEGTCETKIPVKINMSTLEVKPKVDPRPDNRIMFTDTIGVILRDLTYGEYKQVAAAKDATGTGLAAMASSIECVINGDEVLNAGEDFTQEEIISWLESMMGDDFDKIEAFIKSAPTLYLKMPLTCPHCGAKGHIELEGLDDFLV